MGVSRCGAVASPGETALLVGDFLFLRVYDYCRLRSTWRLDIVRGGWWLVISCVVTRFYFQVTLSPFPTLIFQILEIQSAI